MYSKQHFSGRTHHNDALNIYLLLRPFSAEPSLNIDIGYAPAKMPVIHMLDYAAGNVRSLVNAIEKLGWHVEWIRSPEDVSKADVRATKKPS
jgi:hypothetical protein